MPQEESVLRLGRDEALEAARLWQECGDAREFACRVLGSVMNALMDSEAQQMCGASVSVNIFFTIFTNVFSPNAPTRMRRIRQRGCAAFGV